MILVDSSVIIKAFGGRFESPKVRLFDRVLTEDLPFAICPYVYQEVLQGVADDNAYRRVQTYLATQQCLWLPPEIETFDLAARIYWELRRKGVTVRSTMDVLIALTAIHHDALLLHDDRDYDLLAAHLPELKILADR